MLQNGRRLFVKGAESLVHFDIHILAVMILKAAIKLTVTSRGARGQQHKASPSSAAPIAPAQDYSHNTSFFQPPLFFSSSLSFYYSLHLECFFISIFYVCALLLENMSIIYAIKPLFKTSIKHNSVLYLTKT